MDWGVGDAGGAGGGACRGEGLEGRGDNHVWHVWLVGHCVIATNVKLGGKVQRRRPLQEEITPIMMKGREILGQSADMLCMAGMLPWMLCMLQIVQLHKQSLYSGYTPGRDTLVAIGTDVALTGRPNYQFTASVFILN